MKLSHVTGTVTNKVKAVVFNIQRFSIHDGPGIRTTIFVKGCSMRCLWCHNPESWAGWPEVLWARELCIGCGVCLRVCEQHCHRREAGKRIWDRDRCIVCGACTAGCPAGALEMVGKPMTVEEVMAVVEKDRMFYEESGGGVTVSGGEPLLPSNLDFTEGILQIGKKTRIHMNIQTNLFTEWKNVLRVLPWLDFMQVDLKAADPEIHLRLTGMPNENILENIRRLSETGKEFMVRIPVIPGLNDSVREMERMAEFLAELKPAPAVELLTYHRLGESKFRRMEKTYPLSNVMPLTSEQMNNIEKIFAEKERLKFSVKHSNALLKT